MAARFVVAAVILVPACFCLKRLGQRPQGNPHILIAGFGVQTCILSGSIMGSGSVFQLGDSFGRRVATSSNCRASRVYLEETVAKLVGLNIGFRRARSCCFDRI